MGKITWSVKKMPISDLINWKDNSGVYSITI